VAKLKSGVYHLLRTFEAKINFSISDCLSPYFLQQRSYIFRAHFVLLKLWSQFIYLTHRHVHMCIVFTNYKIYI